MSIENWNTDLDNANDLFIDFYTKLKGCVDRHAPIRHLTPKEVKLKGCVDRHAPIRRLTLKEVKLKNKPWITSDISKMIKITNRIFVNIRNSKPHQIVQRIFQTNLMNSLLMLVL